MNSRDVIPHSLSIASTPSFDDGQVFDNYFLRYGEVQEILYVDNKANRSKRLVEYNVYVQHKANGVGLGVMYTNCVLSNLFGGLADECHYMLRAPKTPSVKGDKNANCLGLGTKVLILCPNGERANAYIVGGIRDIKDDRDLKAKDLGHHYYWIFNGISQEVDKEGQYTLTYNGKTEIDGKRSDGVKSSQVGSFVKMLADGGIKVADTDAKNAFFVDHANSKIVIARDKAFELGAATDKLLLGSSFRDAQKQMNNKLKAYNKTLQSLLQNAGTQLNTAGAAMAATPIGGAVAAGPQIVAAGALLIAAANIANQISQAIDDFEQGAAAKNSFLSDKNSAD